MGKPMMEARARWRAIANDSGLLGKGTAIALLDALDAAEAEVAELRAAISHNDASHESACAEVDAWRMAAMDAGIAKPADLARVTARADASRSALRKFAAHPDYCMMHSQYAERRRCTCGLTAAWEEAGL